MLESSKLLYIDLSNRRAESREISKSIKRDFVGGAGLASRLLFDYCPPKVDPFSAENPLIFAVGPFTGTMIPTASKYCVVAKSPLTGFIGDSLSSSGFALSLRRAGFSAIVITGKLAGLSYLFIDDGRVHFRDASNLAGLSCLDTELRVRDALGDASVSVASIGQAGEKLVRFACIGNDFGRQAGRTGMGAVMGSKGIKAIAIRGTGRVDVADAKGLSEKALGLIKKTQGSTTEKYRLLGTLGNVLTLDRLAVLPTRNYQQSTFEGAEKISGERLYRENLARVVACSGCSIGCDHYYRVVEGLYSGVETSLDYESLYALGPLCGVSDPGSVIMASDLCDRYGIDTMSAGVTIAWAIESFERGLLTEEDFLGLRPSFGDGETVVKIVELIGKREGIGRLLGEGVKRAAQTIGGGSDSWAMHVKGLELPGYEPRALKTLALGLAVCTRGACHNRSAAYEADMSNKVDRLTSDNTRGKYAMDSEDFASTLDTLGLCKFIRRCFADIYAESSELLRLAEGVEYSPADVRLLGERTSTIKKLFNIREGWTRSDDWLPPRILEEALPTGVAAGVRLTADELEMMIDSYYQARGWTKEGLVPEEKLRELGLADLALTTV